MALGLNEGGGNFTPYIKYNAKAGRWYVREGEGNEAHDVEVQPDKMVFVADIDNIEIGWIKFPQGGAPETVLAPATSTKPDRPADDFKSGFRLKIFSAANLDGLREWMASSTLVNGAINELYDAYEKEVGNHAGECPVVRFTGAQPVVNKHGTNYKPGFEIVQWTARPAEFDGAEANPPAQQQSAPATGANDPPPPPPSQPAQAAGGVNF